MVFDSRSLMGVISHVMSHSVHTEMSNGEDQKAVARNGGGVCSMRQDGQRSA